MFKIRYQCINDREFFQTHGLDYSNLDGRFLEDLGRVYTIRNGPGPTTKEWIVWLCLESLPVLRVWINNIVIWDWDHGFYEEDCKRFGIPTG